MIVAVCAAKGSPGVTTLTLALGVAWPTDPGSVVVLEADPSGGDLAFRLRGPGGRPLLAGEPSVLSLAVDSRTGLGPTGLASYAQPTPWGIGVIPGPPTAAEYGPIEQLWPQVAAETADWPGIVVADLGRLPGPAPSGLPSATAGPAAGWVVASARLVLVVTRANVEGFYRTRDLVAGLGARLPAGARVGVVIAADPRTPAGAADQLAQVLAAAGAPAAVAGVFSHDPLQERLLRDGGIPVKSRLRRRGDLWASVHQIAETVSGWGALAVDSPDPTLPGVLGAVSFAGGEVGDDQVRAGSGRST